MGCLGGSESRPWRSAAGASPVFRVGVPTHRVGLHGVPARRGAAWGTGLPRGCAVVACGLPEPLPRARGATGLGGTATVAGAASPARVGLPPFYGREVAQRLTIPSDSQGHPANLTDTDYYRTGRQADAWAPRLAEQPHHRRRLDADRRCALLHTEAAGVAATNTRGTRSAVGSDCKPQVSPAAGECTGMDW